MTSTPKEQILERVSKWLDRFDPKQDGSSKLTIRLVGNSQRGLGGRFVASITQSEEGNIEWFEEPR